MATLVPTQTSWQWPADVRAFAARQQVEPYLEPLRQALDRLFPTARSVQVLLEADPEIRDDWHIVLDVRVRAADIPDYVAAKRRWHGELFAICPAPLVCIFRLSLLTVDS
jgi:hypothetical protein